MPHWSVTQDGEQVTLSRDDNPTQNFMTFGKMPEAEIKRLNQLAEHLSREGKNRVAPKGK